MQIRYSSLSASRSAIGISTLLTCLLFNFVPAMLQNAAGQSTPKPYSPDEIQRLGQRMYREGILPSGGTMESVIKGDIVVPGTSFTCVSCHMLSGFGSIEGGVITIPANGKSLYNPRKPPKGIRSSMSIMGFDKFQPPPPPSPARPAYTDESLASTIRGGLDPSGRVLDPVMPRYKLSDRDMAVMIEYLKSLSSSYSPGIDDQNMRFATVVSEDVPPELRDRQAALLEKLLFRMNEQARVFDKRLKDPRLSRHVSKTGRMIQRNLTLSRWVLKGAPETWKAQLEEYYRREPVFALLGGIANGDWKPVHDFSETNRIPCLFPQTEFPVVSDANSYTFYLSKGHYQEGEAAAWFINRNADTAHARTVVQIVRETREGSALSTGFEAAWRNLGQRPPQTVRLKQGESVSREMLEKLIAKAQPSTLLVWDGAESIPLLESIADMKNRPEAVFISSSSLGKKTSALPDHIRDITFITHPYRLPQDEAQLEEFYLGKAVSNGIESSEIRGIMKRTYPLSRILIQALSEMKENFHRDYLLDIVSMSKDLDVPLYERLSFGPGQRYASKGCYIVQLSKGNNPSFIRMSDWVTH